MGEYRLSKVNNNDLEPVKDKQEVAKVLENTKLIPKTKNQLARVVDNAKVVCMNTGKGLVKATSKVLTVIGNKLAKIDWKKLLLTLLKELLTVTQETQTTTYYTYKIRTTSRPERHTTKQVREDINQGQIQTPKTEERIGRRTEAKSIKGKNQKSLEGKNDIRQIQNKELKSILKSKQQPEQQYLRIEKQKYKEDYNNRKD